MGKLQYLTRAGKTGRLNRVIGGFEKLGLHSISAKTIRILKTGKFFAFNCPCRCFVLAHSNPRYGLHLGKVFIFAG